MRVSCRNVSSGCFGTQIQCFAATLGGQERLLLGTVEIPVLNSGASMEAILSVDAATFFGDRSRESLVLKWNEGVQTQKIVYPMPYVLPELSVTEWAGRAGMPLIVSAALRAVGDISGPVDLVIRSSFPGAERRISLVISPSMTSVAEPLSFDAPASLPSGTYHVVLDVVQNSTVVATVQAPVEVQRPEVAVTLMGPSQVRAGETVDLQVLNTGGANVVSAYELRLVDRAGLVMAEVAGEIELPLDSPRPLSMTIPPDVASGEYRLAWEFRDKNNKQNIGTWAMPLSVEGLIAQVRAETDKEIYPANEPVEARGAVTAGPAAVKGHLHLEVKRAAASGNYGPGWPAYGGGAGRKFWTEGDIDFAKPGYRWRMDGLRYPVVGRVLPGNGRQVVCPAPDGSAILVLDAATGKVLKNISCKGCGRMTLVDLNHDGLEEIVVPLSYHIMAVSAQDGILWDTKLDGSTSGFITIGDYDGQGTLEIFAATNTSCYLLDAGTGQIIKQAPAPIVPGKYGGPPGVSDGDLDHDGLPELVLNYYEYNQNCSIALDGDLSRLWTSLSGMGVKSQPAAIADLNGDGENEVIVTLSCGVAAVAGRTGEVLWRWFGNYSMRNVAIGDINGDNALEVVVGTEQGAVALSQTGTVLWTYPLVSCPNSLLTLVKEKKEGRVVAVLGSHCLDMKTGDYLWRRDYFRGECVVADVDADGRMELVGSTGCLDDFTPLGTTEPVPGCAEVLPETFVMSYYDSTLPTLCHRAEDGSLWYATSGGFSYFDPATNRFGWVPASVDFPYIPIGWGACGFKNNPEGLAVYTRDNYTCLDLPGYIDTSSKTFIGIYKTGYQVDPGYRGWLEWEGYYYTAYEDLLGDLTIAQNNTRIGILDAWGHYYGLLGVGPYQTAYALVDGEIWGYSFVQKAVKGPYSAPVTATDDFNGAIQVAADRALVLIPTCTGLTLYIFNPLTRTFTRLATETELKNAFNAAAGRPPMALQVELAPGTNGAAYVLLADGRGLPYLFLLSAGGTELQYVGAFVGASMLLGPEARADGSVTFLLPGMKPMVKTIFPGGSSIITEIPVTPVEIWSPTWYWPTALSPFGEYCVLVKGVLYRVAPSGSLQTTSLPAVRDWTQIYEMEFGADPDLLYLRARDPVSYRMGIWELRISTGQVSFIANTDTSVLGLLAAENGALYFNDRRFIPNTYQYANYLYEYLPGIGVRTVGKWSDMFSLKSLVKKEDSLIYALTQGLYGVLELGAMDIATGTSTWLGEADLTGMVGTSMSGATYNPSDGMIYLAYGPRLWRWDALSLPPVSPEAGGAGEIVEETVWFADYPLDLPAGAAEEHRATLSDLKPGQYLLTAAFKTDRSQELGRDSRAFAVVEGDLVGLVRVPGEPVKVKTSAAFHAKVANLSTVLGQDVEAVVRLQMQGQDPVELLRSDLFLAPGESRELPITVQMDKAGQGLVRLELWRGGKLLGMYQGIILVAVPEIEAGIEAPAEVGRAPFQARAWVRNTGEVPADLVLYSDEFGFCGRTITLAPGEEWSFAKELSITSDTALRLQITGDCVMERTAEVVMAEHVTVASQVQPVYPDGMVTPGILLVNTGRLTSRFPAYLALSSGGNTLATLEREVFLGVGESLQLQVGQNLAPGTYVLSWSTPFLSGVRQFEVKYGYAASMTASCREQGTSLAVDLRVVNEGLLRLEGQIEVASDLEAVQQPVSIMPGASEDLTVLLPLPLSAGTHVITARLVVNGKSVATGETAYTHAVPATAWPKFEVQSMPEGLNVVAGEQKTVGVTIRNVGLVAGRSLVGLVSADLPAQTEFVALGPGEERTLQFILSVPEDRESGTYQAEILVDGVVTGSFTYTVEGIKLQVSASTDKKAYLKGDDVVLTLQVVKLNGGDDLPLLARVKFGDWEETRELYLGGPQSLTFTIPAVTCFGQKLFYGFYHGVSERSIYLDSLYVYEDHPAALVTTDKQIYNAGEIVRVSIIPHRDDWCTIIGSGGFRHSVFLEGPYEVAIPLGPYTPRGTHTIRVEFGEDVILHHIDVRGPYFELVSYEFDKALYLPGDSLNVGLTYNSDLAISCRLTAEAVGPDGGATLLGTTVFTFTPGEENRLALSLPLGDLRPGIHRLYLRLYGPDETLLHVALVYFKLGEMEIERIDLSRTGYPVLGLPVEGTMALRGEGAGLVTISLDGRIVETIPVALAGGTTLTPFTIPAEAIPGPGRHLIEAALTLGEGTTIGRAWFDYGTDLPDLVVHGLEVGYEPVAEKYYPVRVEIAKTGRLPVPAAEVRLAVVSENGERFIGSIASAPIGEGPGSTEVEFLWDAAGEGGEVVLVATVEPGEAVVEYDVTNNTYEAAFAIPACPIVEELPEVCSRRIMVVEGTADPGGMVSFRANEVMAGGGQADLTGAFSVEVWLQEGVNEIACWAVNADGRRSPISRVGTILVDTIPPEILIHGIADGAITNRDVSLEVQIEEANPSVVLMTLDGIPFGGSLTVIEEGSHLLLAEARDLAGNTSRVTVGFVIDKSPPIIRISGVEADRWYRNEVAITVETMDFTPVQGKIFLDGREYDGTPIGEEGRHVLCVEARDAAGNFSRAMVGFGIDKTPPSTTVGIQGAQWSDGWYKEATVTLSARDNEGGSWIRAIYYRLRGDAAPALYYAPFTIDMEGRNELSFYAVDEAGNQEAVQTIEVKVAKPWSPAYTLLCGGLEGKGNVKVESGFSNGPVSLNGNCGLGYLGTTQGSIDENGNVKIERLVLAAPPERLPIPDWDGLAAATLLRGETSLAGNLTLSDVRFAGDLTITGNVKIGGLLVVEGDLTLDGNLNLDGIGIFCRGKITITGNATIKGLVYAGKGLEIRGNPKVTGVVVVDGPAEIRGNITGGEADMTRYTSYLKIRVEG
ncbi:MAG: OmpL47-type beta-barrel domain-containing protein [Bacillota bacterium]